MVGQQLYWHHSHTMHTFNPQLDSYCVQTAALWCGYVAGVVVDLQ